MSKPICKSDSHDAVGTERPRKLMMKNNRCSGRFRYTEINIPKLQWIDFEDVIAKNLRNPFRITDESMLWGMLHTKIMESLSWGVFYLDYLHIAKHWCNQRMRVRRMARKWVNFLNNKGRSKQEEIKWMIKFLTKVMNETENLC